MSSTNESPGPEEEKAEVEEIKENNIISLQLGDVIRIEDPTNDVLNNNTFIIDYIDRTIIRLIQIEDLNAVQLRINEDGTIGSGSITEIDLLYRNDKNGYARQNDLLPETWINVFFGGETPVVITGQITNLEEDMIEIKTYPDGDTLYINFGYRGIPLDLPIETIEIRKAPERYDAKEEEALVPLEGLEEEISASKAVAEEEDESFGSDIRPATEFEKVAVPTQDVRNQLKEFIIRADEIHFGRELGPITQYVDVDASQQRFAIETQTNDLLEELLSKIPNVQRTTKVLNNVHIMIERFKQLRAQFSEFDAYGNVIAAKIKGADWKPLAQDLIKMKTLLFWLLPVVKNVKKVYNISAKEDTEYPDIAPFVTFEDVERMETIIGNYYSNNAPIEQNKYINMMSELNPHFTPFEEVNPEMNSDIIYSFNVESELNTIIDNLGDFYSSIAENDAIKSRKFVIQKYNTALSRLEATQLTGSKMIAHRVNLGASDTMELKSIVSLPEPTIRFSNINLPGTSILEKANLNAVFLNYWQLLKQKTNVNIVNVDSLDEDLEFDENNFVNNIKSYVLEFKEEYKSMTPLEIYKKYLNVVVPKTRVLFNLMKKYITGKLSVKDVVGYLEPFLVYTDDLTYMQFKEINQFLEVKISEYNKKFIERSKAFSILKRMDQFSTKPNNRKILDLLLSAQIKKEVFEESYDLLDENITTSETIATMIKTDFGNVFNSAVSLENLNLMLPQDVSALIEEQREALEAGVEDAKEKNKCATFVIAKQYSNVDELMADNGKTIYFDRKYDNTLYSLLDDYEKEQMKMDPDEFNTFLVGKLKSKYKYNEKDAEYMAETLVNGVKKVVDDNIATVFILGEDKISYYRRENNRWELDETINAGSFNANSQDLLCNFQNSCIEVEQKFGAQCESYELNKKELQQKALKSIVDEFDKNYQSSKEELELRINQQFDYFAGIMDKLKEIERFRVYKYNYAQYDLGVQTEESSLANVEEIVVSPFLKLRDMVLGQTDFVKKQNDIVRFANRFTREAVSTPGSLSLSVQGLEGLEGLEDPHWRYCIETSTKLLPNFIYVLASQFIEEPSRYIQRMDEIIKTNGAKSDDGDAWVDKFSGYIIRKRDLDDDEGFEDGRKASSREIMEQDAGDALLSGPNKQAKYQTIETQMAANVINAMAANMGISIEEQREFILKIFSNTLPIALPTEADYKTRVEEAAKKGKTITEYRKVYNTTIMYLSLGALLIGIQVSIPSVRTRKTFPGCVRSFVGFPYDGVGDLSALNYLCCIAYKIRKAGADPWSGFSGEKEATIATKLKNAIEAYYLSNVDVMQKFREKTDYLLANPAEDIPKEHDLSQWLNFLPPLVPFKLKHLENISEQFKSTLLRDLKTGSREQRVKMLIVESKIIYFSLALQEKIQKIISKKQALLANSANEPFLENACCNTESRGETSTLEYFEKEDPDIKQFNEIVQQLSNILYDVNHITEAPYLFSRENTKNIYPPLGDEFSEETIYRAFITFCKFNSLASLNEDLIAVCTDKPDYLNMADSISEKIRKLKQDGRIYNNEAMLRLLQIVGRQNIVHLSMYNDTVAPIQKVRVILEDVIDKDDDVVPSSLVDNISGVLDTYDIAVQEDTEEMRKLKNYLARSNGELKKEIHDFLSKYGGLSKRDKAKIKDILDRLVLWEDLDAQSLAKEGTTISDDAMYNAIEFIKSYLQNILKTFPNIIINSVDYQDIRIPTYLGLSRKHATDIKTFVGKYYSGLNAFYKNKTLTNVLRFIQQRTDNLLLLANNTPAFADIKYKETSNHSIFDRKTSLLLFENYFLQALREYVRLADDDTMLVREVPEDLADALEARTVDYMEEMEQKLVYTGLDRGDTLGLQVQVGNMKDLKEKTAKLLLSYLNIMNDHKNMIDFSYERIMDLVFKTREREKDTFTDRLQAKSDEERNVDTILKINKLGVWSKGLQKGLTSYVKEDYDDEREYMEQLAEVERKVMRNKDVTAANADQFMEDLLEEQDAAAFIEREEADIGFLTEDYMDGDYQGGEEENFGDYN